MILLKTFKENFKEIIFFTVVALLSIFLLFYNLGKFPLENWDEAFYGQTVKDMLALKDFIVLHWNYEIWLEKPPMYMWISSLISLVFGLSEWSLRLPSAFSAFVLIFISSFYVFKKYSPIAAIFTFFTLFLNNVFIWRARSGNIDLLVSLFIFVIFLLILSKIKYKYPLLGIMFAFIYLTKASLVLFPFSIFVLNEIFFERKNLKKNLKEYLKLFGLFALISGTWLLLGYLEVGKAFIIYNLFQSDQGVAAISKFNQNYILHAYYSLERRFFYIFIIGAGVALLKIRKQEYFLLLSFAFLLLFQLSFTQKDNNWYLIPSMPFWSILIGFGVFSILNLFKKSKAIYLAAIIALLLVSSYIWFKTLRVNILPILNSSSTIDQTQSAREISKLSNPSDIVVRLDPLIPTTLYYDNRKTLAYSQDTNTHGYWIGKDDLIKGINDKKIKWLVGTNKDITNIFQIAGKNKFQRIKVNDSETILKTK